MAPQAQAVEALDAAELVERAKCRDEAAIRAIVRQHNRRLFRLARSIVRDDGKAEEVVQETYIRAFTRLDGFRGESSFGTWLCRIALNEALSRLRKERAGPKWVDLESAMPSAEIISFPLASTQLDPERTMAQREIQRLLERAIDNLPDRFRTVLVARLIEGMSIEDTASLLRLRPETVKTRLHRARKLLREAIEEEIGPVLTDAFPFDGARCQRIADTIVRRLGLSA